MTADKPMKVDFYIVDYDRPDVVSRSRQPETFTQYRKRRILAQKKDEARRLSAAAGIAVEEGLRSAGLSGSEIVICLTEAGKPCIAGHPETAFNVSHSGRYAVAAFAEDEDPNCSISVGVDIECISRMNGRIASVMAGDSGFTDEYDPGQLCRRWTAREAFVKCTGAGLSKIRDDFFFEQKGTGELILHQKEYDGEFSVLEPKAPDGYHITCVIRRSIKGGIQ